MSLNLGTETVVIRTVSGSGRRGMKEIFLSRQINYKIEDRVKAFFSYSKMFECCGLILSHTRVVHPARNLL